MERQYIGARYVPKFADPIEWNDQTSYEALTIVTYMGASYTSKKDVPAGVKPTDNSYWAVTGNYNAQVEAYRQETAAAMATFNEIVDKLPIAVGSRWVTVGAKGCNFTTINDAINAVKGYATESNRVTIFITAGDYNEEIVLLPNIGIDFVGIGRVRVVFPSVYPRAPLFISGNAYIENIHFYALNSSNPSYSVHIEAQTDATPTQVVFKNCEFTSNNNHGVGIGLGNNYIIEFYNSRFISNVGSGLYAHNFPLAQSNSQVLRCYGCYFYGDGGKDVSIDNARAIQGNEGRSVAVFTFANCSGKNGAVSFRSGNDTLGYIPKTETEILVGSESNTNMFGVDYLKRSIDLGGYTMCSGGGYFTVPFEIPHLYNPTITYAVKVADGTNILDEIEYSGTGGGVYNYRWSGATQSELISISVTVNPK